LESTGLSSLVSGPGPLTLFAPMDSAFEVMPSSELEALMADNDMLKKTLERCMLNGTLFTKGMSWMTHSSLSGEKVQTQVFKAGVIKVASSVDKSARLRQDDMLATNGVVHAIDMII
jgi:uncharacterized surface protein with fasciclin (FAS1) repeats